MTDLEEIDDGEMLVEELEGMPSFSNCDGWYIP